LPHWGRRKIRSASSTDCLTVKELVNGYICSKELDDIDNYIVPASLNDDQGIMGAIRLGLNALEQEKS